MGMEHMVSNPRHIVVAAGCIRDDDGRVLMILSPKRGWENPGGRVEEGESLPEALRREVREETGIDVQVGQLAGVYTNLRHSIVIFTFFGSRIGGVSRTSDESLDVVWLDAEEALRRIEHPAVRMRFLDLCNFDGRIIYRSYVTDPFELRTEAEFS
jgi:8-oxo-dGTP diphosphatase